MATSSNDLAQAIKDAHQQLIDELWGNAILADWAAAIARRCARIIEKIIELARGAARAAKAPVEAIAKVVENVRKSVVAAMVTRTNVDRNIDALLKYAQQSIDEFNNGAIRHSPKQLADTARYNTYRGTVKPGAAAWYHLTTQGGWEVKPAKANNEHARWTGRRNYLGRARRSSICPA
ncbi:hypothetical protein [Mycolicibacterium sp.]|uniref:hypothetical protein n=1 Tax=Mycolicibacterium sp. TaxID=2320850 RepID=UPI0037C7D4BB